MHSKQLKNQQQTETLPTTRAKAFEHPIEWPHTLRPPTEQRSRDYAVVNKTESGRIPAEQAAKAKSK